MKISKKKKKKNPIMDFCFNHVVKKVMLEKSIQLLLKVLLLNECQRNVRGKCQKSKIKSALQSIAQVQCPLNYLIVSQGDTKHKWLMQKQMQYQSP